MGSVQGTSSDALAFYDVISGLAGGVLGSLEWLGELLVRLQDLCTIPQWQFFPGFQPLSNKTGASIIGRQGNLEIAEAEKEAG